MPFARRIRLLIFTAVLATLILFYLINGPEQTRSSEFYTRTVALMEAKARGLHNAQQHHAKPNEFGQGSVLGDDGHFKEDSPSADSQTGAESPQRDEKQKPLEEPEDNLRDRLKEAESQAKKSADDKYRALKDIQDEVQKGGASGPAGFQKQPVDAKNKKKTTGVKDGKKVKPDSDAQSTTSEDAAKASPTEKDDPETTRLRHTLAEILTKSPVTIFSKSYCPHSAKAKKILLEAHSITPKPYVIELNERDDGPGLQLLLMKTTGRRTVPNVLVNGKSIGGGDETEMLWKSGELPARIKQMAGKRVESIKMNFAHDKETAL